MTCLFIHSGWCSGPGRKLRRAPIPTPDPLPAPRAAFAPSRPLPPPSPSPRTPRFPPRSAAGSCPPPMGKGLLAKAGEGSAWSGRPGLLGRGGWWCRRRAALASASGAVGGYGGALVGRLRLQGGSLNPKVQLRASPGSLQSSFAFPDPSRASGPPRYPPHAVLAVGRLRARTREVRVRQLRRILYSDVKANVTCRRHRSTHPSSIA